MYIEEVRDYAAHLILLGDQIKKLGWARRVERMEKKRSSYSVLVGKRERRSHLEDLCVGGSF